MERQEREYYRTPPFFANVFCCPTGTGESRGIYFDKRFPGGAPLLLLFLMLPLGLLRVARGMGGSEMSATEALTLTWALQ